MSIKDKRIKTLLEILSNRFDQHMFRHASVKKDEVFKRLNVKPNTISTLLWMEESGGEPDVVDLDLDKNKFLFVDCVKESPVGRRSLCYDEAALKSRKENKPKGSALGLAKKMGAELLNEMYYKALQEIEPIDLKTSSWILTPESIRQRGGALFGDNRYGATFIYHNGAESYYAARGFRCFTWL